jgi:rhamnogalacturonyl hydrolase YesR
MNIYRNYIYIVVMIIAAGIISCSPKKTDSTALFKIADDVVEQTKYNLPNSESPPESSRYNAWMYQNYLLLEGMDALYEATGDNNYGDYANLNIDYFAEYQAVYGDNMSDTPSGKDKWYTNPQHMWQCGMIAKYAERQLSKPNEEFERGIAIFDSLLNNTPSFEDGTLVRMKTNDRGLGVQIDDLYMLTPYWCRKAILTGDNQWLELAIEESLRYHDYLWNEDDQLMKCLWLLDRNDTYGLYWGRGNGWYIMALTDMLPFIPEDHPKRQLILNNYQSFIDGIVKRQNHNGLWHQLLDDPDSFTESSCSGMFTYCLLKGVNEQWLEPDFLTYGIKGWEGLQTKVNSNYQITDVCPPSDMSEDPSYYLENRKGVLHDQHGIGPFILAGAEYLKAVN